MNNSIAVWNTAFLGDAVLTLPLIQSLKAAYPERPLDFYVRPGLEPLFSSHSDIRHVYAVTRKERSAKNLLTLRRILKMRQYGLWVCAHPSPRSAMVAKLSSAPVRVGYSEDFFSRVWFTHTVSRRFYEREEIERLLSLLEPLDIPVSTIWPSITLPAEALSKAYNFFAALHKESTPVLGIHPGSVWATKRWPPQYFAYLVKKAIELGTQVLLFAGPDEEDTARKVSSLVDESVSSELIAKRFHNLSGALSLPELAAYIAQLSCYVTNDSGPMHLAWAQHVPVTALFGPTVRQLGFFPRGLSSSVMEVELDCRPCGLHGPQVCPKGHHDCMNLLAPDLVWANVAQKLWP